MKIPRDEIFNVIECMEEEDDDDGEVDPKKNTALSGLVQVRVKEVDTAERFLGDGKKIEVPVVLEHYYENLLAVALKTYLKTEKWKVVSVLGLYKDSRGLPFSAASPWGWGLY